MKPKVYIETSVVSYFTAWPSRDVVMAAHQALTHEWWRNSLPRYQPVISQFVLDEVEAGDPAAANLRLEALADIAMITAPAADVEQVVKQLMARRAAAERAL